MLGSPGPGVGQGLAWLEKHDTLQGFITGVEASESSRLGQIPAHEHISEQCESKAA